MCAEKTWEIRGGGWKGTWQSQSKRFGGGRIDTHQENMGPGRYLDHARGTAFSGDKKPMPQPFGSGAHRFKPASRTGENPEATKSSHNQMRLTLQEQMGPGKYLGHDRGTTFTQSNPGHQPFGSGTDRFVKPQTEKKKTQQGCEEALGPGRYLNHETGTLFTKARPNLQPFGSGQGRFAKPPRDAEKTAMLGPGSYVSHMKMG